ncbi:MAG: LysM peptidoglycan-binding domain-containing protein [Anaerolineales bacterium]
MRLPQVSLWVILALTACAAPTEQAPATVTLLPLPANSLSASDAVRLSETPSVSPATPVIIASPTPTATPVTHVVQAGETLISVAVDYGVSLAALQTANPSVSPRFLSVGAVLLIPTSGATTVAPLVAPTPLPVSFGAPACHPLASGAMYCFVEARNPNAVALEGITARVTLAGTDGLPLTDALAQSVLGAVAAGGMVTMAAYFENAPGNIAAIGVIAVTAFPLVDLAERYLPIEVAKARAEQSGSEWVVAAQLRNGSATNAAQVKLALTLYDAADAIIGYRQQSMESGLTAAETQTVTISATPLRGAVARYTLQAQGRP